MTLVPVEHGEVMPLANPPPTILAQSRLSGRMHPRHAAVAALSHQKQLDRQTAHAQMRVQYRRALPLTMLDFQQQRGRR